MKPVFLAFALLLAYTSFSTTSPIADDEFGLPFRYPVWWRPSEDARSYWDPLIARLIWTHPALRRYYKELAGWDSSNADTDRPSLLGILNEYEEQQPFMLGVYREDNNGETVADEEPSVDRREAQTETQTGTVSGSEDMGMGSESQSSDYGENESQSESSESSEESESDSSGSSEESESDSRESSEESESEVIAADRKRRSDDTENQLLRRILLWRKDLRSKLGKINGVQRDTSNTDVGQPSTITIEQLFDLSNMSPERLTETGIDMNEDVMSMEVDKLKIMILEALMDTDVGVDSDQAVDNLLDSMSRRKLGDISGTGHPSRIIDRVNKPLEYRDTAASGGRTAKRDTAGVVPETRMLTKVNTDDVDVSQLLDDLGIGAVRIRVRQTDNRDYTTEQTGDDDTDSGDPALVDTELSIGDTSMLESRKKRIIDGIM